MTKLQKVTSATLAAFATAAAMATAASAQVLNTPTTTVEKPFSIKLGVTFPGSGAARNYGGNTQFSAGLDYAIAKTTSDNPILPSIYGDYVGGSRAGGFVDTYGIGVAIRSFTSNISENHQSPYFGAGIGVYDSNGKKVNNHSGTDVGVGGKVFVGEEIGGGFFVEGNYQFLPSVKGINPSGLGVQAGLRF